MKHTVRFRATCAALLLAVAAAACTGSPGEDGPATTGPPESPTSAPTSTGTAAPGPEPSSSDTTTGTPTEPPGPEAVGAHGVSAGHPEAVAVGMEVLDQGGTAVDAAIATAYAVSVVEPFASGVGGGGSTLIHRLDAEPAAYDYREVVAADGRIPETGTGIPGFVAGMEALHADHGQVPLAELIAPAIRLAADGVPTSQLVADQLTTAAWRLPVADLEQFYPDGQPLAEGDPLVQDELATTLQTIAEDGAASVYQDALGGALTQIEGIDPTSLANYTVNSPTPAVGPLGDLEIIGAAPPLTGVTLVQMLQMAAALGATESAPGSVDFVDAVSRSWERAGADLMTEVGDPAYVDVPLTELTDPEANAEKVEATPPAGAAPGPASSPDANNTTHIVVVDADGTMVSMTNTLTNFWGSGQEVGGFFLNNQLGRFEIGEGAANAPEPGKRSISYSTPTIVADDQGRPVLGIGSPGGSRIPNVLTQVILRWGFHGTSLAEAVDAPRFHAEDGTLYIEQAPDPLVAGLTDAGYTVEQEPPWPYYYGSVQALEVDYDAGELTGARDHRRAGDFEVVTR